MPTQTPVIILLYICHIITKTEYRTISVFKRPILIENTNKKCLCNTLENMLHGRYSLRRNLTMATTQPIRNKQNVRELATYYLKRGQLRNHVLIVIGLHTALRISDLLRLKWEDVYDFERKQVRTSISIVEKKTHKPKTIALNNKIVNALVLYAPKAAQHGHFLIENSRTGRAISRIQAYRLTRDAAEELAFQSRVSCHSLRKTFGYHAWKSGVSPAVIMDIYNHSSLAVTRRYLGVTQDDKDEVYLGIELMQ